MTNVDGLGELEAKLEELEGTNDIPFTELFPEPWMQSHTDYDSIEAFVDASQWEVKSTEDFAAIPDEPWDEHVQENSQFEDWEEMLHTGANNWISSQF